MLILPFGILGQVWYLIVSIPDPCCLSYFDNSVCTMALKVKASRFLVLYNDDLDNGDFIEDFRVTTGYKTTGVGVFISYVKFQLLIKTKITTNEDVSCLMPLRC